MRKLITVSMALLGAAVFAGSPAGAVNFDALGGAARPVASKLLVQVHSRKQVHDMLHRYGYDRVVYETRYHGDHGKPVYVFRACQGRRAFSIEVNWYGHIISQHPSGRCHDGEAYNDEYRYGRRRDW